MNVLKLAWRNVWRNSRRSTITIAAMSLALWTELLYGGLVEGMLGDMSRDATEMELGDVAVFTERFLERPSLHEAVPDAVGLVDALRAQGFQATPRLQAGGLAASGELSSGVAIIGVDPMFDGTVLRLDKEVGEGAWLDDADPKGVIVGRRFARTLALKLGSELVVLSQAADGTTANELFTVRGILSSVAASTDRGSVIVTEAAFRELFVFPTGAHRVVVKRPADVSLDEAAAKVAGLAPGMDVRTWKQLNPLIAQMLDAVQVQIGVIYFVMYVAVAILVLNAMLMAVFERIREFGVLKAIGYSPSQVFWMMVAEGMFQAAVAGVIGVALAVPFMFYLQTVGLDVGRLGGVAMMGMTIPTVWHAAYSLQVVRLPIVMLFAIVFFAVLYPAAKAAWIRPVEAMHHQ